MNRGIADLQSAALPLGYDAILVCRLLKSKPANVFFGAGNETRTRYLHLGKVALYRMSYTREEQEYYSNFSGFVKEEFLQIADGSPSAIYLFYSASLEYREKPSPKTWWAS